jgi:hypothetical protein
VRVPRNKFFRIRDFVQSLFPDEKTAQQASQIITGIMIARSPRLSEIAIYMPVEEAACYKRIQRFLQETGPQEALRLLFNEEAGSVIFNQLVFANILTHVRT